MFIVKTQALGSFASWVRPVLWGASLSLGVSAVQGQDTAYADSWRLGLGLQRYSEAGMRLQGPEVGLHWRSRPLGQLHLEADALLGLQNYSSNASGTQDEVLNVDTRWRLLTPLGFWPQWHYGLALHTRYNDLRGLTSAGDAGYERLSAQLWLPVRWSASGPEPWEFDAGVLLWGRHMSRLSQTSRGSEDVTNTQRSGFYVQASTTIESGYGSLLPYVRWTWVDDSNTRPVKISGQINSAYEPRNSTVQLGVQWRFR